MRIKIAICLTIATFIVLHFAQLSSSDYLGKEKVWKEYKRRHFIVYYKEAPLDFVKEVEKAAEQYYEEITNNLGFTRYKGWTWDERVKIYIYDDHDDYIDSAGQARWSHGAASARRKTIHTFPSAHGFFDSTLPHELGHIIFREFVGFRVQIPRWFEEGVAMYQEKAKRWGSNRIVKKAIETEDFIPLDELSHVVLTSKTDDQKVKLFYAESASIVYYMISELGEYRFVQFCRKIKSGDSFIKALTSVYFRFKDLEHLNKSWVEYLEK